MRSLRIRMHGKPAGILEEFEPGRSYRFRYDPGYDGPPVSLTMPVQAGSCTFERFPPFFDGLLPEGSLLMALLQQNRLDPGDYMGQLLAVGQDPIGAVTIEAMG
jgi:serine/threonine-protein kinase HipA